MDEIRNKDNNQVNINILSLINKLANSNDIQSYKNKFLKYIEDNNKTIFGSIKNDNKTSFLLTRTYYLNEFDKIEKSINSNELLKASCNLNNQKYFELLSYLNVLVSLEDLCIYKKDIFKNLQLQIKIINIIKNYLINKIIY